MADWFYLKNGEQKGPVPKEFIQGLAQSGQLQRTDLVWTEGMKDWLAAETVPDIPFPRFTPPPGSAIPGGAPAQSVSNYLVWSILTTVFCCLPSGIAAIIYSSKVNTALALGDYSAALEASKKAKMWNIIGLCVGLVTTLIYGLMSIVPMIMAAMKAMPMGQ
ncbi:MAG: CD225/dispanin family protein [Verrucomicrobia bacterium]|nr:CD225/dispanin family protein [Verrucomicrobiota bacterium]MCG2680487.1 CD225/dispanin family protein [Kiritimatiellia bacterium]MBU4247765.1 CD225/dispanin family protein [Verrucomicrobiota bacterium]MBU4289572.1 CD225/dispanin family protein [Verrucomicrobiota bacterium]MBU4428742.1 CD225/dispanin family protein [Verrucomicrobiota bacterium]